MSHQVLKIRVDADAAQAYNAASLEQQRQVDTALNQRLRELMRSESQPVAAQQDVNLPPSEEIHPEVLAISGLVPAEVDAKAEYNEYLLKKHQ